MRQELDRKHNPPGDGLFPPNWLPYDVYLLHRHLDTSAVRGNVGPSGRYQR